MIDLHWGRIYWSPRKWQNLLNFLQGVFIKVTNSDFSDTKSSFWILLVRTMTRVWSRPYFSKWLENKSSLFCNTFLEYCKLQFLTILSLGCARFSLICANSCAPYNSITMETPTPANCKSAKIHQNEHTPGTEITTLFWNNVCCLVSQSAHVSSLHILNLAKRS